MHLRNLQINYQLIDQPESLPPDEALLLDSALAATEHSYAPFSEFKVGCAVALEGGEVVLGNNQENIAFPSGLCAERTALFSVGAAGKAKNIRKIAIRATSKNVAVGAPPTSCGACRQVMVEYERLAGQPIIVLMQGEEGKILRIEGIQACLMPFSFDLEF